MYKRQPKQRAPLAEAETSGKSAAKSLLTMLPSIEPASNAVAPAADAAVPAAPAPQRPDLRAALPSLSGAIARPDDAAVSTAGAFVPAGATGAFAPVGDELLENVDPDDIYAVSYTHLDVYKRQMVAVSKIWRMSAPVRSRR